MATNPPYRLVADKPWTLELETYVRYQQCQVLTGPRAITWQWAYHFRPLSAMRVRPWVLNCATQATIYLGDWVTLDPPTMIAPAVLVDVPTGDYLAGADIDAPLTFARCWAVPFRMQREATGGPPQTHVGEDQTRHEVQYSGPGPGYAIFPVPATRPVPVGSRAPLRAEQHYSTFLKPDKMWASHLGFTGTFMRQFFEATRLVGGQRVSVITAHANRQQYYDESVRNKELPIIDGERGENTDGIPLHIYPRAYSHGDAHAHTPKQGQSWWLTTPYAIREKWEDGSVVTLLGERLKAGEFAYDYRQAPPQAPLHDPELLPRKLETLGHWIDCTPGLFEAWFTGGRPEPNAPGHEDHVQVEHWGWTNDSYHHRVLSFTHFTAHANPAHYVKSAWMPNGYVAPEAPHGQTDVMHLAGNKDGTPMGRLVHLPWSGADLFLNTALQDHAEYRDRVVFSNKWGSSLCWVNLFTGEVTPIHLSPVLLPPTAQEKYNGLQVWNRATMRSTYPQPSLTEWFPLDQLRLVRPSAMDMFSDGNLCLADDATGWIFDIDLRARRARVIYTYLKGKQTWIGLAVNWRGDTGVLDCIRITGWSAGGDQCITRQGAPLGQAVPGTTVGAVSVLQGPADHAGAAGYPMGIAVRNGYIVCGDGGHYELHCRTAKTAADPVLDAARYARGLQAWNYGTDPALALTHGPRGQGRFGLPTAYEMATWDDARFDAYLTSHGLSVVQASDVRYMIRWDMAGSTPLSTEPPADSEAPETPTAITAVAEWAEG